MDLSWPCGHSVNDGIPKDSYLGVPFNISYPSVDVIVDAIIAQGPGCQLFKRDLRKAYRQFPIDPIILFLVISGTEIILTLF